MDHRGYGILLFYIPVLCIVKRFPISSSLEKFLYLARFLFKKKALEIDGIFHDIYDHRGIHIGQHIHYLTSDPKGDPLEESTPEPLRYFSSLTAVSHSLSYSKSVVFTYRYLSPSLSFKAINTYQNYQKTVSQQLASIEGH